MASLIIVESPTKAKTIQKYFKKGYKVISSVGHIIDLPKSKLGIDIESNFTPHYITIKGKGKVIKNIKDQSRIADEVFIATDPDREGEAIAYFIKTVVENENVKRALFYEITKEACEKSLKESGDIDYNKVEAQKARRVLDRLVGYLISPYLWKLIKSGLSAGRVQTVALRLICEREDKIRNFKEEEYWTVKVLFKKDSSDFTCDLVKIDGKKPEISSEKQANDVKNDILKSAFHVTKYQKSKRKQQPPPPYITSSLQIEASRKLNFSAKKTMMVAQQLFEGIDLGKKGTTGLITYMRTDSTRISEKARESAKQFIASTYGEEYTQEKAIRRKTKKFAQEAHEAIRPTNVRLMPQNIKQHLSNDQYKLYNLIFTRFIASQMAPAIFDETKIELEDGKYTLKGKTSVLIFDGFSKIYPIDTKDKGHIPSIDKGENIKPKDVETVQHFTQPPARYTEGTLVKELEAKGIGRPSTYASIISRLLDKKYVIEKSKTMFPTELGEIVEKTLVKLFPDIFHVQFTSKMEMELDEIEEGKKKYLDLMREFYAKLSERMKNVEENRANIKKEIQEETDKKCPKCGAPLVIKWGRFGKFLACSNYPDCKYTEPLEKKKPKEKKPVGRDCPKCGAPLVYVHGKYGDFIACSNYPKCKYTESITTGIKCPEKGCDGEIVQKRSKRGRIFYGCSNYPKCKFSTWYKPVERKCPKCGNYYMEEHKNKDGSVTFVCPKCGYEENE
ncbi:type I DNA topoisomerase [candidate division TA06 bacterium]|uniref:DNA topoisomerase 1 n=1 Tax=candidate division TA06 bacterium TaxID=2250710 RepID=A0A660S8X8_UNCT6|nr:MAG: type I DNA topoisomerase [candidate division TA06 bacterium]